MSSRNLWKTFSHELDSIFGRILKVAEEEGARSARARQPVLRGRDSHHRDWTSNNNDHNHDNDDRDAQSDISKIWRDVKKAP